MSTTVTRAQRSDAAASQVPAIRALFRQLDSHAVQSQPQHFRRGDRTEEYLLGLIDGEDSDFLLAELEGETVGFSLLFMKEVKDIPVLVPGKYAYIQDFVVREDCRGRGIGTRLMEASKEWARQRGALYLRLSVLPDNTDAQRFYARHGLAVQMVSMECGLLP